MDLAQRENTPNLNMLAIPLHDKSERILNHLDTEKSEISECELHVDIMPAWIDCDEGFKMNSKTTLNPASTINPFAFSEESVFRMDCEIETGCAEAQHIVNLSPHFKWAQDIIAAHNNKNSFGIWLDKAKELHEEVTNLLNHLKVDKNQNNGTEPT